MTEIVPADEIEKIVGVKRSFVHIAKAYSSNQLIYILHSHLCRETIKDLRNCVFSKSLFYKGINQDIWADYQDISVPVTLDEEGELVPLPHMIPNLWNYMSYLKNLESYENERKALGE